MKTLTIALLLLMGCISIGVAAMSLPSNFYWYAKTATLYITEIRLDQIDSRYWCSSLSKKYNLEIRAVIIHASDRGRSPLIEHCGAWLRKYETKQK